MKRLSALVSGILGGACIAFGCIAYLSVDNKVVGSMLFTVGLFIVCTFGLNLFTGKVCYIFERGRDYALNIPLIWLGNLTGTGLVAAAVNLTRIAPIAKKAAVMCQTKLNDSPLSILILAVFCNFFIFVGVDGFNNNPHELGRYISLFFGVMVFILCSFEHCVANMFYFSVAGAWSGKTVLYLLIMTLGNAVGGIIFPLTRKWMAQKK